MKIIKPSIEILESLGSSVKEIERAARNCYLSYDKQTESSAVSMTQNLIKRGHTAMLEFGDNLIFTFEGGEDTSICNDLLSFLCFSGHNQHVIVHKDRMTERITCSMNPRTALEIYNTIGSDYLETFRGLKNIIYEKYSEFIDCIEPIVVTPYDVFTPLLENQLSPSEAFAHVHVTVKAVTNRTVLAQWTRHRKASYAVTSMRYINWTKDRFGSELSFVAPVWYNDDSDGESLYWNRSCIRSEIEYFQAIKHGLRPEQARCKVLPDVRTDIVCKASLQEWDHIFKERCNKAADPEIRRIMIPLQEEFSKKYPGLF